MIYLDKLITNVSASLNQKVPELSDQLKGLAGILSDDLIKVLYKRNGFYSLEGAFHVLPSVSDQGEIGLAEWNGRKLWIDDYNGMADECLFFAEDVFGGQFCIKHDKIYSFDPETASLDYLANNLEEWAEVIIKDYRVLTGYPLAHDWQVRYGKIPINKRLLPKIPFVAGGEFKLENLYLCDSVTGMKIRADIANQIKNLTDGAQIKLNIVD